MKKIFVALSMIAFLVACDDSASAGNNEPTTLSSIEEEGSSSSSSVTSAGSVTLSSSSLLLSDEGVLSRSSSSETKTESSSSEKLSETSSCSEDDDEYSSSSVILATPCKTETEDNCEYGELKDNRDGQTYKTVKIGDQWWMAENLNYADSVKTPSLLKRNWCTDSERPCFCSSEWLCYNSDRRKCVLPDTVPGICPNGWHLPNSREWSVLMDAVGGKLTSGKVLRSQSGWYSNGDWYDDKGLDSFGFNALPAGQMSCPPDSCFFNDVEEHAYFWTSAEYNSNSSQAYCMNLWYASRDGWLSERPKKYGHSIRCVKD